jgi:membrane-associated protein
MLEALTHSIIAFGYIALFGVIFAESGLFFGFFLPGDSLLFTAGVFAAKGDFNIVLICVGCFIAAVAGDQVGYWFGNKVGKRFYQREDSFLFRKEHIEKTKEFYAKYGKSTIILARFTPIVRTFAPIVAGIADMNYKTFITYNIIGGLLWAVGLPLLGFYLGTLIPDIDRYIIPVLIVIIIASIIPAIYHLLPKKKHN